jgi:general transcription factor IIIA
MNLAELAIHAIAEGHPSLCCTVPGCTELSFGYAKASDVNHYRIAHGELKYECAQCGLLFDTTVLLDEHGGETMHNAYVCQYPGCKSESTRFNDLIRHQLTHMKNSPRHSCPHCHTYRGNNGFRRKDHLQQHIRNYHHIGELEQFHLCLLCNNFLTLDKLTDHFRHQHNSLPFFCPHKLCDRVGMNGFETERLKKAHLKKYHPSEFQCSEPGCDRAGTKGWMRKRDMVKHMKNAHGVII